MTNGTSGLLISTGLRKFIGMIRPNSPITLAFVVVFVIASWSAGYTQSLTAEEVLAKFTRAAATLSNLHYTTHTIDSFVSGYVRVQHGEGSLSRNGNNQQFPFLLHGKDDDQNEFIFDGQKALNIKHEKKEFEFQSSIHYRTFIGLQGGQMIIPELLFPETQFNPETGLGYDRLSVQELSDEYILTIRYPDNNVFGIRNRVKRLTIDKKTALPVAIYHKLETIDGEKQVNIRYNSNIRVDEANSLLPAIDTVLLKDYHRLGRGSKTVAASFKELLGADFIDMKLKNTAGSTAQLSKHKGKVILLVFWEPWCSPCIESIPKIKAFVNKYPEENFEVWGIASDEHTFAKVPAVVKRTGVNYPVYYGTEQTKKDYRVTGVPEYVIIDQSGKIAFIEAGFSTEIEKTLDALLKQG